MPTKICVIDGHPDPSAARFIHALCNEYCKGAESAGHEVSRIDIASHKFEPLVYKSDFDLDPDATTQNERIKLLSADHIALMFPLWLGSMPAATRAFFEQAARGEFFVEAGDDDHKWPKGMMKGKSARVVVTMGMPAIVYKTLFKSAALKAIERGMFGVSGFKPIVHTILGGVENSSDKQREKWLAEVRELGYKGI